MVKYRTACDSGDQIKTERERAPGQGNVEMEAECLNRLLCEGGGGEESDDCGRQTEALKNGKRAKGILSHGNVS